MDEIWKSFFNQLFHVAEDAMSNRKIPYEDLVDQEAYIYWALIGGTILRTIENSMEEKDGIRLATGRLITSENCPDKHKTMFKLMLEVKNNYPTNKHAQWTLQQMVLYASSKRKVVTRLEKSHIVELRRMSAQINRISIHISQQQIFREKINDTLEILLSMYREI